MTYRAPRQPRRRRDVNGDLWIDGQAWLGRNRVPPMPNRLALTDRITGQVLVLSSAGGATPVLEAPLPSWSDVTVYGKYDGPYYGLWRLYVANGAIFAEPVAEIHNNALILTRWLFNITVLQLTVNSAGTVIYTPYTL